MKRFALILAALGTIALLTTPLSTPAMAANNYYCYGSYGAVRHVQDHAQLNHRGEHRAETHHNAHQYPMTSWQHAGLHNQLNYQATVDEVRHNSAHVRGRYYDGRRWVYGYQPRVLGYYPVVRYYPTSGISFGTSGGSLSFGFAR